MKREERATMRSVVRLLGINCDVNRPSVDIPCPICAKNPRQKKLHIAFDKNGPDDGVFRCAKCGESGGPIGFWGLYRGISDFNAAVKDYFAYIGKNEEVVHNIKKQYTPPKRVDVDTAKISIRAKTYSTLIDILSLSKKHYESLIKDRGLDKDTIVRNGYRSYPISGHENIAKALLEKGCVLEGVPGFYINEKGKWQLAKYKSGILIPQRDGYGRIQSFQIRNDVVSKDEPRYISLSSRDKKMGAPSHVYCHLAKGSKDYSEVILTEGALKADIISFFTGYNVLAIPGVSCQEYLPIAIKGLKQVGLSKVLIAFDMDVRCNERVQAALDKLKEKLEDAQVPYSTLSWDGEKGLDDFLYAHKK